MTYQAQISYKNLLITKLHNYNMVATLNLPGNHLACYCALIVFAYTHDINSLAIADSIIEIFNLIIGPFKGL